MGTYRAGLDSARQNRMGEIQGAMGLRKLQKEMEAEQKLKTLADQYVKGLPEAEQPRAMLMIEANPKAFTEAMAGGMFPKPTDWQREMQGAGLTPEQEQQARMQRFGLAPKPELPSLESGFLVDRSKGTATPLPEMQGFMLQRAATGAPRTTVNLPKMTDDTRKEFMGTPAFKNWETVQRVALAARSAAKRNDKASDYDLITAVAKVVDPESVVRESEFTAWGSAQSPTERLQALAQYLSGGGVLTPSGRQKLLSVVENRAAATKKIYDATKKGYEKIAGARGLPPEELFFPDIEQDNDDMTARGKAAFEKYNKGR
jgi:hypothetical protein